MSLTPITKPSSFFRTCTSIAEVAPDSRLRLYNQVHVEILNPLDKEQKALKAFIEKYPDLLIRKGSNIGQPLSHTLACYAKSKSVMELCVQIGGQAVLEVGNNEGATPIFCAYSYQSLKRITDLGASVNVLSKLGTVLENIVHKWSSGFGTSRCIKHLLRLGACIQENSPLTEQHRIALTSVYQEFSREIATVSTKIEIVAQCILVTDLQTIILDYALGEEDSETPVYDDQGKYTLDDETEAYAYIKSNRISSAS